MMEREGTFILSGLEWFTDDEFLDFCLKNGDLIIERNADRTIVIMHLRDLQTGSRNANISMQLANWADRDGTGIATGSSGGFLLPDTSIWAPEAAWTSNEQLKAFTKEELWKFPLLSPEFTIELASPFDFIESLERRMKRWMKNGVQLGWLINPEVETVKIYRRGQSTKTIKGFNKSLPAGDLLPGFELDLTQLMKG